MEAIAHSNKTIAELEPSFPKENDSNLGPSVLRTLWTLLAVSSIFVAARLFVKCRMIRRLYWDDLMVVIALVRQLTTSSNDWC